MTVQQQHRRPGARIPHEHRQPIAVHRLRTEALEHDHRVPWVGSGYTRHPAAAVPGVAGTATPAEGITPQIRTSPRR
jgi:hypothetical protein